MSSQAALAGVALSLAAVCTASAQTAVLVVRHAEKQSESNDAATPLSEAGRARAARLADLLKDAGIAAIFSTDTVRTRSTAEPLARRLKLEVRTYPAQTENGRSTAPSLAETLRRDFPRDVVLVVGHSNTVPDLIRALGCIREIRISADEYDNLFTVVPRGPDAEPALLRLRY